MLTIAGEMARVGLATVAWQAT